MIYIIIFTFINISYGQLSEIDRYEEGIVFPEKFLMIQDGLAITVEPQLQDKVIKAVDLENGNVLGSIKSGRGPGEVSTNLEKEIVILDEERLWIWDSGLSRGFITDHSLNFIEDIRTPETTLMYAMPLGDDMAITWTLFSNSLLFTIRERYDAEIKDVIHSIRYMDFDAFAPLTNNPLARQGSSVLYGNSFYQGYLFSSAISFLDEKGNLQIFDNESEIPFPDYTTQPGVLEAPDRSQFPEATLSISANSNYLFILHSGKLFDAGIFKRASYFLRGRYDELEREYDHSDKLLIYNRISGELIYEMTLPEPAKHISVTENYLYSYTYYNDVPTIIKYQLVL